MKKIIIGDTCEIRLGDVGENKAIFAKKDGALVGMVVREGDEWIVKVGGGCGATGYHKTRRDCIESTLCHGFEFYIEEENV